MRDVCSLIWLALIGLFRSRASLQAEILTLRHQLNVLRRKSPQRLGFTSIDRLILQHDRRQILWLGVTAHPTAEWISHQLTEAYGSKVAPRYIIRDRDAVYGDVFIRRLRAMSIRDRPTAPRSPWQNGYCERAIGSIRRECLDHVIVFGERHLRHLLRSYASYYNEARTHLSVKKDAPMPRTVHAVGRIVPTPFLGGLHHLYVRV
jgi:Integrase core domain